jgi:hypothetical protein
VGRGKKRSIAYYISAHGYGHGVRSCSIINAVNSLCPQVAVHVVSRLPFSFLGNLIDTARNPLRPESLDTGMIQLDSIRVDVPATLMQVEQLYSRRRELVAQEVDFLRTNDVGLIVADIPGIPIEAAALLGIPRLAVGNFAWDWIYSAYASRDSRWKPIVELFQEEYAKTNLLLRLPFCEEMKAFPRIEDIPLVASPGYSRRGEIAAITGCDPEKKWILLSFTDLDWDEDALGCVEQIPDYELFTVLPLSWQRRNIHALDRERVGFSSAIASVDAVISKPGFGILSDCVVNRKPLIYADRSDFAEYQVLETSIKKYLKHVHIPATDLYRGNLAGSLERIWQNPDPVETLPSGGDRIAAQRIAEYL